MGRVLACSDLHGRKDLLDKILAFLNEDDTVYFLGDAADRGPQGWECIKTILNDNRFIYLLGNHEDMLIDAAYGYYKFNTYNSAYSLLRSNGGKITFYDMKNDPEGESVIGRLRKLPTYAVYVNAAGRTIFLSHAGFTPWLNETNDGVKVPSREELIWDRRHYLDDWSEKDLFPNSIIMHGHTPIPYIMDDLRLPDSGDLIEAGPLWYSRNRKVCLDCAAFATGAAFLLDLDTFEHQTFTAD